VDATVDHYGSEARPHCAPEGLTRNGYRQTSKSRRYVDYSCRLQATSGSEALQPFWQEFILSMSGPVSTALVGTLIIGLFVSKITEAAQARREDSTLRTALIKELAEVGASLYLATQHYQRLLDSITHPRHPPIMTAIAWTTSIYAPALRSTRWKRDSLHTSSTSAHCAHGTRYPTYFRSATSN